MWGRRWGASDDVGRLRSVLVRAPRDEWAVVRADAWNEAAGALVDPGGMWYWESRTPPDLALVREQHRGLVAALERRGSRGRRGAGGRPAASDAADLHPRSARDRARRRDHRPDGAGDAPRRGADGHPGGRRARHADPAHDHRDGPGRGRKPDQAQPDGRRLRHVDPLQRRGRRAAAVGARGTRYRADRRADGRLVDPPRRAPGHGLARGGAGGYQRPAVLVPRPAARTRHRGDPLPCGRGVGDQLARARARADAHGRRLPAHAGSCSSGADSRSSRSLTTRSRRAAAASTARRWSSSATLRSPAERREDDPAQEPAPAEDEGNRRRDLRRRRAAARADRTRGPGHVAARLPSGSFSWEIAGGVSSQPG